MSVWDEWEELAEDECSMCGDPLPPYSAHVGLVHMTYREHATIALCAQCRYSFAADVASGIRRLERYLEKWAAFRAFEEAWARVGVR